MPKLLNALANNVKHHSETTSDAYTDAEGGVGGHGVRTSLNELPSISHSTPISYPAFPKIERYDAQPMVITQKIHGTNALVYIFKSESGELDLRCGSRTRWIAPGDDNYGFAAHVHANKQAFLDLLGEGFHYGEWAGPGINSGEGLKERCFFLFDHWKHEEGKALPPQVSVIPVLYKGRILYSAVDEEMNTLRVSGSRIAEGFMRPEGVVVTIGKTRYKKVFSAEESAWKQGDGAKERIRALVDSADYSHLLQPVRLEKLLSRDSRFLEGYPKTLPDICSEYFADLIAEDQIQGTEDEIKAMRKGVGSQLFSFIKESVAQRGLS